MFPPGNSWPRHKTAEGQAGDTIEEKEGCLHGEGEGPAKPLFGGGGMCGCAPGLRVSREHSQLWWEPAPSQLPHDLPRSPILLFLRMGTGRFSGTCLTAWDPRALRLVSKSSSAPKSRKKNTVKSPHFCTIPLGPTQLRLIQQVSEQEDKGPSPQPQTLCSLARIRLTDVPSTISPIILSVCMSPKCSSPVKL